jgi:hypothetical protein
VADDPVERLRADMADLRHELHLMGLDTATMRNKLDNIERDVEKIITHADTHYVSLNRYMPVEKVLYGMVGLILVSFVGALLALVVRVP